MAINLCPCCKAAPATPGAPFLCMAECGSWCGTDCNRGEEWTARACSAVNKFGSGTHPEATPATIVHFGPAYLTHCLSRLSATELASCKTKAVRAYDERAAEVRELMAGIEQRIDNYRVELVAGGGRDWGYAGSLGHVREQLTEIARFLRCEEVAS